MTECCLLAIAAGFSPQESPAAHGAIGVKNPGTDGAQELLSKQTILIRGKLPRIKAQLNSYPYHFLCLSFLEAPTSSNLAFVKDKLYTLR